MPPKRLVTDEWLQRKNEPYRLRCASCETRQWYRKSSQPRQKKLNQYSSRVYLKCKKDELWDGQYYCKHCGEHNDGVVDMKTGELVCKEDDFISQDIDEYESTKQKDRRQQRKV